MQTVSYYSADDIATAESLQFLAYTSASMATFWTYDYACSLQEELTFLLRSRWTMVKSLYIITRHVPFLLLLNDMYLYFTPNENPNKCQTVISIYSCLSIISVACSEFIFVLRTYALWNNNRIILRVMLSAFFAVVVACVVLDLTTADASHVTISAIPGIQGCYRSSAVQVSIMFILLLAFQLGLISLTIIRAVQTWRVVNGPLYDILVKHNIFYYTCALLLTAVNVLTQMLFSQTAYRFVCEVLQFFILAILATRMHLFLWQIDRQMHGSEALVHISMSDM
ncbi:hypothetical protein DFJ58DRAFT_750060 [Suillus subalutaceus]|uniref:uncharacterized protein n=1 Tax=Suillus subalutaceus TaxID=48586 RepID=UPI001B88152D|nr:uncharacterized protein DFJ58DRAFT_750060 [Suillus subalutaceus]KAG1835768.1 hypothetical protein DFJ58DRAFT_750060 [Suillus subalutaceus]